MYHYSITATAAATHCHRTSILGELLTWNSTHPSSTLVDEDKSSRLLQACSILFHFHQQLIQLSRWKKNIMLAKHYHKKCHWMYCSTCQTLYCASHIILLAAIDHLVSVCLTVLSFCFNIIYSILFCWPLFKADNWHLYGVVFRACLPR